MKTHALTKKIRKLEHKVKAQHLKLGELKRKLPPQPVEDYELSTVDGRATLSSLFGEQRDLVVIHNMGRSCPYCTMWADGFNGLLPYLESRAAFVVVSPDSPKAQQAFAAKRGWKFRLLSGQGSPFSSDMGFMDDADPLPGMSTFRKKGRKLYRIASAPFGPFDPFVSVWHMFDLLDGGTGAWEPKYQLPGRAQKTAIQPKS